LKETATNYAGFNELDCNCKIKSLPSGWQKSGLHRPTRFTISFLLKTLVLSYCLLTAKQALAAMPADTTKIGGHIYDNHSRKKAMPYISVQASSGIRVFSDQKGHYSIPLQKNDTVRFYDQAGKLIVTYPAAYMLFYQEFNVYLQEEEFGPGGGEKGHALKTVRVTGRDYQKDSLETRRLYGGIFDYQRPKLSDAISVSKIGKIPVPLAVGINISGLARWLQVKETHRRDRMKRFAHFAEDESYIEHRLSSAAIEVYTGLKDEDSIQYLMLYYRPAPEALRSMNELELGMYLIKQLHQWRLGMLPSGAPSFTVFKNSWNTDSAAVVP